MFTGIVEGTATVRSVERRSGSIRLSVGFGKGRIASIGDSIALNGVCLTAVNCRPGMVSFDVVPETLRRTNLGELKKGDAVNFERSMKSSDLIGGHIVAGHIDGTGRIVSVGRDGGSVRMVISVPPEIGEMISDKGFVAVDGASLTPAEVSRSGFTIYLIPQTLERTVFKERRKGDLVNIEVDIFAKYVKKFVEGRLKGR
ncbi:MAG: riboflavin synthase [Thermoplasmata archaeon]|uniref:Riboflavin synthase n=1 Tax=Candidatus Sysuiplasma superficiale TaxID=2823368 RepID=A0A8J8CGP3_9ARCH|nr:riboflavin synthase [Candidatus Sysuiplasma superficiale]